MPSLICDSFNKFDEQRAAKIFASRRGGNLIEFDGAVRHADQHLDNAYVRAGYSRNRIIHIRNMRSARRAPGGGRARINRALVGAPRRVTRVVFYEVSLLVCPKTSSVLRCNGLRGCTGPHGRFTTTTRSRICVFYAELMTA